MIHNLYFDCNFDEVGLQLMIKAENFFNEHKLITNYAFYHAMGMSCNAYHGKLFDSMKYIETILLKHKYIIEYANNYYRVDHRSLPPIDNIFDNFDIQFEHDGGVKSSFNLFDRNVQVGGAEVSYIKKANIAYLNWIWLKKEQRGKGVGSYFMKKIVMHLASDGYEVMDTDTAHDNVIAQKFYERNGFIYLGTSRSYLKMK